MSEIKALGKLRKLKSEVVDYRWGVKFDRAIDSLEAEIEERYMELPLDEDGLPICVGDVLDPPADCNDYVPLQVVRLMYDGYEQEWFFDGEAGGFCGMVGEHMDVAGWTHHHARTVEDVLDEFASFVCEEDGFDQEDVKRCAEEIRELMGGDER